MRLLGLDYGSKTVGVAVTDPLGYTAQPLETITRKEENKLRRTLARIEQLVGEYQIEKIVLGYPVNMDGSAGERAELALAFKAMLERRTKLEVIMQDERLTTVQLMKFCRSAVCLGKTKNRDRSGSSRAYFAGLYGKHKEGQ